MILMRPKVGAIAATKSSKVLSISQRVQQAFMLNFLVDSTQHLYYTMQNLSANMQPHAGVAGTTISADLG